MALRHQGGDDLGHETRYVFGRDEILLSGLRHGAPGAVGSTYNYAAPLYHRIMRAFAAGDVAAAEQDQARAQEFIGIKFT